MCYTCGMTTPDSLHRAAHLPPKLRPLRPYERARVVVAVALLAMPLLAALLLTPDARGHGTHQQLGLPPCMMMQLFGIPCALCGMTTAFAWFARGHLVTSFTVQPAGALMAATLVAAMVALTVLAVLGRWPAGRPRWLAPRPLFTVSLAVLAAAWVYKLLPLLVRGIEV